MDIGYKLKNENPKKKANIISKLFFGWMMETVIKGTKKCLELKDLYKTLDQDKSDLLGNKLEKHWNEEVLKATQKNKTPSLLAALKKTFFWEFMIYGLFWFLLNVFIRSSQPVVLAIVINCFSGSNSIDEKENIYIYSSVLVTLITCAVFVQHHTSFGLATIGMRMRIAVSTLVYRKITRLDQKSLAITATGQVVNLLSNDVNRFDQVVIPLHAIWVMPFQVCLLTWVIWNQIGISSLAGLITMITLSVPLQGYLSKITGTYRARVSRKTDKRVKLMSEIVSGIQVIKMYAWEKPFELIVKLARAAEIKDITVASYLRGLHLSFMVFLDKAALCFTIICYVLLGHKINADIVFSLAQSFNILQSGVTIWFPVAVSYGAEALISVKRLQSFLILEERQESKIERLKNKGVVLNNINASWTDEGKVLENISVNIQPGILCAIVGPVGAGKTSFLQLLLGELSVTSGKIQIGGEISYTCQEPWLFQSTIRNNILFGQTYDKLLYEKTVKVCALERDFEQFSQGDKTIVGERGVSLSGGQRARINLARSVYRQSDIYLFDDPLSAVDTHVGKHLFEECFDKHLKGKTRILVTHQLQYLKKAQLIVVLSNGKIEAQGSFEELSKSKLDFTKFIEEVDDGTEKQNQDLIDLDAPTLSSLNLSRRSSTLSRSGQSDSFSETQIDEEESGQEKNVQPFKKYILATNHTLLVILVVLLFIIAQVFVAGTDLWVAFWTEQEELRNSSNSMILQSTTKTPTFQKVEVHVLGGSHFSPHTYTYTIKRNDTTYTNTSKFDELFDNINVNNTLYRLLKTEYAMYVYVTLIVGSILLTVGRSFLFFKMCMLSSINLHSQMFHALLKAPMRFFDVNPSGRVLNRFSKDVGSIDEALPKVLLNALQIVLTMIGILVNISISNPYMIIAIIILGATLSKMRAWYISTAKIIKHLEGITKSPVFSHVNSTIHGITTIRALNAESILINEFDEHQDKHTSAWYLTIASMYSFGLWLDIICVVFGAVVIFSFVILQNFFDVSGSMVGLAISQSMILTGMLQYGMRETAEVINQLTSVERVLHYTTIDQEGPFETPEDNSPVDPWPKRGQIEFRNVYLQYSEDDVSVINNLNFSIMPGQKIGIVGRTGAGKSSLIAALFRLARITGSIFIDGVDIQRLGLTDLRKKISIIPQEPVLFSATVRYNLDPFNEFSDEEIWQVLEEVELKDAISSLDFMVTEGGGNFSLGQRQLVCLARAALRNNKILVLDEATANVDLRTDALIQETIRKKFKTCTVLTIAHRLNTIMDSDKVLIMSFGSMVEFGHPHQLLQIPDGYFHKMVLETGPVMSLQLKDVAMVAYKQKMRDNI